MQTPGTTERLGCSELELKAEMKIQCADGTVHGGIDAWIVLGKSVWWLQPFALFTTLPVIHALANMSYRAIARNRYCLGGRCHAARGGAE